MKQITIDRQSILAELRNAYRLSLSNRSLYHTIYLYDDGTVYDFTDCSNNSWLVSEHIVAQIASYRPDVSGSCIDSYLYGLSASEVINVYREYMTDAESARLDAAIADGRVDADDVVSVREWLSDTAAHADVCEEAIDYEVGEADANGDFDGDVDALVDALSRKGYEVAEA